MHLVVVASDSPVVGVGFGAVKYFLISAAEFGD